MEDRIEVVLWAGVDIWKIIHLPSSFNGDHQAIYQEVCDRCLPGIEEEFGEGSELHMISDTSFEIRVDKVVY